MDLPPDFLWATVLREWVWEQFINGFCVHLVRPLVLLLVFAITFLGVGRSYGLPALFLRSRWHERFAIGAGVGVLVWQAVLAGYLFEEFATNYTVDRPPFCEVRPETSGWGYGDANYQGQVVPWPDRELERDPFRYRYVPASVVSIGRYAGNLAVVCGVLVAVGLLGWAVRSLARRLSGGLPATAEVQTKRNGVVRYLVRRVPLVGGGLAGWAVAAGVSAAFLPGDLIDERSDALHGFPVWLAYQVGERAVGFGGWGNSAARAELINDGIDLGTETGGRPPGDIHKEKVQAARVKYTPYYPVYGVFFLGFGALVGFNLFLLVFGQKFSPAAGILLLLHLVLAGQTFIDYFSAAPTLVLLLVGGVLVAFARRYRMRFPGLEGYYRRPLDLQEHYTAVQNEPLPPPGPPPADAPPPAPLAPLTASQLGRWNDGEKKPLVVVCASGGGSRAAAWTMKVLTTLEERLPGFPYHIRLITGASGGMFGAAYYTASLPPPGAPRAAVAADPHDPPPKADSGAFPNSAQLNDSVRGDFLTPVVREMVRNDLVRPFLPFTLGGDRGAAIEAAWSECLGGWLDGSFADLWAGELAGWRPSLAFSPMMVEDGRQLVISNLSLRRAMVNLGHPPGWVPPQLYDDILSREGVEFFKLFESCGHPMAAVRRQFKLSTAARMSASFPYLFPAVPLPTHPRRRVVDAGYYDNYGVCLAAAWLFTHLDWLKANVSRVAVIHIRDGVSTDERLMLKPAPDTSSAFGLAAEGLTTPPAGLNASRTAASTFRNDNLLHLLNQFFHGHGVEFATAAVEFPGGNDVSLNFTLPPDEAALIDRGMEHDDVKAALKAIEGWWHAGSS